MSCARPASVGQIMALLALLGSLVATSGGAAAARRDGPLCLPSQYDLVVGGGKSTTGFVEEVGISTDGIQPCRLTTTLRFVLRYRNGSLVRSIRGNPAGWPVATQLQPWDVLAREFRWSNWCNGKRPATFSVRLGAKVMTRRVGGTPRCRNRRAASTLAGNAAPRSDRIPAHILPPETPIPLSPVFIRVTNAWLVSDGSTLVAVYAGEAGTDPKVGRFAVVRQKLLFGIQRCWGVDVGTTGAVTITQAPEGAAVERSAQRGQLTYSSAGGESGVLDLARTPMTLRC